jgi:hypothetical protein
MIKLLLGLDRVPSPHDAADALAVAICHVHTRAGTRDSRSSSRDSSPGARVAKNALKSWRQYRPA